MHYTIVMKQSKIVSFVAALPIRYSSFTNKTFSTHISPRYAQNLLTFRALPCKLRLHSLCPTMIVPLPTPTTELAALPRMLFALLCGALIGMERRAASANAGVRTLSLVSLGAAIFSLTSLYGLGGDPSRMGAAISTGIGFLGSGAINGQTGGSRRQLVTAATIWVTAALGVAAACGLYIVATVGTICTLIFLRWRKVLRFTKSLYKRIKMKSVQYTSIKGKY